jgi:hypothetical protein
MKKPLSEIKEFIFENFEFNKEKKELLLSYSLDGEIKFTEKLIFNFDFTENYSEEALKRAFSGLWIMSGISYFKTCLPQKIAIKTGKLSKSQANFFTKIYENGLGEFFVENKLNPYNHVNFPFSKNSSTPHSREGRNPVNEEVPISGTIVPIGGGKDSLVTAKILEKACEGFSTWHVGSSQVIKDCVKILDKENLQISREISPELLKLNKEGALNGHIPISAIFAFLSVITAILTGKKSIAFSNENSANFGNIKYEGKEMNHQYSKSLEFEKDFQKYVIENISPDIKYFSFLRPLTELKIAEIFAGICWEDFSNKFSSCNRNFHIDKKAEKKWCLECSKCAFVGLILSPFLDEVKFREIFTDDFFNKPELQKHFSELLGLSGHKPFECVGETEEAQLAAKLAVAKYPELKKFTDLFPTTGFDKDKFHEHSMPENFAGFWKKYS